MSCESVKTKKLLDYSADAETINIAHIRKNLASFRLCLGLLLLLVKLCTFRHSLKRLGEFSIQSSNARRSDKEATSR